MSETPGSIDTLTREAAKLRKINAALMSRVERSTDQQSNAFALFETAIALDHQVRERTQQLKQALNSLEKTNDTLYQAKQQAEAASSLKSSVLVSVTHDLLQPLNAARLTLSALNEMIPTEGATLAEQIDRSLLTLEDLLRTLLDISRLDAGVMKPEVLPVPLGPLFEALREEFSREAAKCGLTLRIAPTDAVVQTDRLMLRRILQNLLANALRYTQHGGVLMGCRLRGQAVRIDVHDTGPGISAAQREAIFFEFHRGETSIGNCAGVGLGLSIVRRFATALGHEVGLASMPGRGSTFSLTLPRAAFGAGECAAPARRSLDVRFGGLEGAKILLVENDRSSAEALAGLLEKWGCDVAVTLSTGDALERIEALDGMPDAIIADLHLDNGESGLGAVAGLRRHLDRNVPAVIVTADYSEDAARDVSHLGVELLKKPIKPAEMRSLLSFLIA